MRRIHIGMPWERERSFFFRLKKKTGRDRGREEVEVEIFPSSSWTNEKEKKLSSYQSDDPGDIVVERLHHVVREADRREGTRSSAAAGAALFSLDVIAAAAAAITAVAVTFALSAAAAAAALLLALPASGSDSGSAAPVEPVRCHPRLPHFEVLPLSHGEQHEQLPQDADAYLAELGPEAVELIGALEKDGAAALRGSYSCCRRRRRRRLWCCLLSCCYGGSSGAASSLDLFQEGDALPREAQAEGRRRRPHLHGGGGSRGTGLERVGSGGGGGRGVGRSRRRSRGKALRRRPSAAVCRPLLPPPP